VTVAPRTALGLMLAMTVIGSICAPAAVQAASRRHQAAIQWSQPSMERTMTHGHEVVVVTRFRTARTIHSARFAIRLSGGLYARPASINAGTISAPRWHRLTFVIGVPSWVKRGQYRALVQLEQQEGRHDVEAKEAPHNVERIGTPLVIVIHVAAAALMTRTPTPSATATPAPAARQVSATIQNIAFSPNPITVARGSTVTWTNLDGVAHTVTADDGSWGSGTLGHGATYSHVFTSPGSYTYHCAIHSFMTGTVMVTS
jgi:plastocyanin